MSAESNPISPHQFAIAIQDLPVENLYSKAQEIENSISHLQQSNTQLQEYSDSIRSDTSINGQTREQVGDKDCLEAIRENELVIERQRGRIDLLKSEVERRGARWHGTPVDTKQNGVANENGIDTNGHSELAGTRDPSIERQRLTDEELRRQMMERMEQELSDGEEDGMHL